MERYKEYKDSGVQWIGEIPSHWETRRIRYTGKSRNGLTFSPFDVAEDGDGILVLRSSNIKDGKLVLGDNVYVKKEIPSDLMVKKGDILICSRNGSRDLVGKLALIDKNIKASFGAFMMIYRTNMWAPFMEKVLSVTIQNYKTLFSTSTINQLTNDKFKDFTLPIPPLAEQEKIVSYLEGKTSKIDAYVAEKEKEIQLLQELKQKTIADAVTKGLNPDVKMKDSGISWIGMIPEHWETKQLRSFLKLFSEKGHGDAQLLSVTREQGVIERDKDDKEENHNFVPEDLSGYKYIEKGDFAINKMKAWQGSYAVSDFCGIVSPAYYTCKLQGVNKDFFSRAIRSIAYIPFFTQFSKGIRVGQWDLNPNALKSIPFFLPSVDEQRAIVAYIDEKCQKIDTLVSELQAEIDNMKEYKQRLIADCVTGQVKI